MKRFFALLVSLLLLFGVAACAPANDDGGGGTEPPVTDGGSGDEEEEEPMETFPAETVGEPFNEEYVTSPFYNDKNDTVAYVANAMWDMFGSVMDGQNLVYRFGNEATWFGWLAEKIMWSGDDGYINQLKSKILDYPQVDNGFIWSWTTTPYWTVSGVNSLHYDGTFRYISAVYKIIAWENSTDFLEQVDVSQYGSDAALDNSKNKTIYEKTKLAMDYLLNGLKGSEGSIQITEDSVIMADGKSKFFDEWNNTGKYASSSSNYWDNLCFGNYDAYENALFYEALLSMAGIERMRGNTAEAEKYEQLADTVHEKYDELYWSDQTGRYIATIDTDGVKHDYGLTFLNFEALTYGLGDAEKAASIFDWTDGRRIVEGDTSTGSDIMSYSNIINDYYEAVGSATRIPEGLVLAPRANTVAFESKSVAGKSWWHNPGGIDEFTNAGYNKHLENGGYIFYTVYYELMARAQYRGTNDVISRFQQIADVYTYNRLNSDIGGWLEGLTGEFPESGLVPVVYLRAILGLNADYNGLTFAPSFGTAYNTVGVQSVRYGGKTYAFEANKDGSATIRGTGIDFILRYKPAAGTSVRAVLKDGVGNTVYEVTQTVGSDGYAVLDLRGKTDALRVNITVG